MRMIERFCHLRKNDPALLNLNVNGHLLRPCLLFRLPGMQVSFKLTSRGGQAWEKIAVCDWAHYVSEDSVFDDRKPGTGCGDVISAVRGILADFHHSIRNASVGLMDAARRAGIQAATNATRKSAAGTSVNVTASCGLIP